MSSETTKPERAAKWALTALETLPLMASYPGVDRLARAFRGLTWIQIAPGPSLDLNADQLHKLKGKAVLCALSHAVAPLASRGIVPDIIVGCEERDQRHYLEGADLSRSALILDAKVPAEMWDIPARHKFVYSATASGDFLRAAIGGDPRVYGGNTVASPALLIGRLLGCTPLVLVGHDLSYRKHTTDDGIAYQRYAAGTPRSDWLDRMTTIPALDGGEVVAPQTFARQIEWISGLAAQCSIVNASESGAAIPGTIDRNPLNGGPMRLEVVARDQELRGRSVDVSAVLDSVVAGFDAAAQRRHARRWCLDMARDLERAALNADRLEQHAAAGKRAVWDIFHWANARENVIDDCDDADFLAALVEAPAAIDLFSRVLRAEGPAQRAEQDIELARLIRRAANVARPRLLAASVDLARG